MAYTPDNNPYIPGDPYSYDLKWLVAKLKELTTSVNSLNSKINGIVGTKNAIFVETVADLKALNDVENGAYVQTRGYYEGADGGEALYKITNIAPATYAELLDNGLYAELINDVANVKQYGAKGDGITDDTTFINTAIDDSIAKEITCYFPAGNYNHTGITIYSADGNTQKFAPVITGESPESTHIKATTTAGVTVTSRETNINGISFFNIDFSGGDTALNFAKRGTRIYLDNVRTHKSTVYGINFAAEIWLCAFTRLYIQPDSGDGFRITQNGTSVYMDNCYVYGATGVAYRIAGRYSAVSNLAADHCTGEAVYNFYYFGGNVASLGMEGCEVEKPIIANHAYISADNITIVAPHLDNTEAMIYCSDSFVKIGVLHIAAGSAVTTAVPLVRMLYTQIIIDNMEGNYTFTNLAENTADHHSVIKINDHKTSVMVANAGLRPFIGHARFANDDHLINKSFGAMIYTDCKQGARYDSAGNDLVYTTPTNNGDWFIENDPKATGVAGYAATEQQVADLTNAGLASIPLVRQGATADRPASPSMGAMYYDTTISKVIFYVGGAWRDANGTSV